MDRAAACLAGGGLVAFPTETVYGLGANALDDTAIARIFEAKGRPRFNPLIVHVPDLASARDHVVFDQRALDLATAFWPGPLTLVLPRRADCRLSHLVGAGLPTCAVRVPAHPLALALLKTCGLPLAAPSANRSGTISPTLAAHVRASLRERVDLILDGGPCRLGLESTILDLSTPVATLLRPGALTRDLLENSLGQQVVILETSGQGEETGPRSPGRLQSHYAPRAKVRLNATGGPIQPGELRLGFGKEPFGKDQEDATINLSPTGDLREAAANLFAALYALDDMGARTIAVSPIPDTGLGQAINDRLRRAAAPR